MHIFIYFFPFDTEMEWKIFGSSIVTATLYHSRWCWNTGRSSLLVFDSLVFPFNRKKVLCSRLVENVENLALGFISTFGKLGLCMSMILCYMLESIPDYRNVLSSGLEFVCNLYFFPYYRSFGSQRGLTHFAVSDPSKVTTTCLCGRGLTS